MPQVTKSFWTGCASTSGVFLGIAMTFASTGLFMLAGLLIVCACVLFGWLSVEVLMADIDCEQDARCYEAEQATLKQVHASLLRAAMRSDV